MQTSEEDKKKCFPIIHLLRKCTFQFHIIQKRKVMRNKWFPFSKLHNMQNYIIKKTVLFFVSMSRPAHFLCKSGLFMITVWRVKDSIEKGQHFPFTKIAPSFSNG